MGSHIAAAAAAVQRGGPHCCLPLLKNERNSETGDREADRLQDHLFWECASGTTTDPKNCANQQSSQVCSQVLFVRLSQKWARAPPRRRLCPLRAKFVQVSLLDLLFQNQILLLQRLGAFGIYLCGKSPNQSRSSQSCSRVLGVES